MFLWCFCGWFGNDHFNLHTYYDRIQDVRNQFTRELIQACTLTE